MNCCPFLSEKNPFERDSIHINMQNLATVGTKWKHPCVAHKKIKRENSPRLFKKLRMSETRYEIGRNERLGKD